MKQLKRWKKSAEDKYICSAVKDPFEMPYKKLRLMYRSACAGAFYIIGKYGVGTKAMLKCCT